MDVSRASPLPRLIDFTGGSQDARNDFEMAMHDLKITSVFDIMRRDKVQFVRECVLYTADDAARIYDRARDHAWQIDRLYREQEISSHSAKGRGRRSPAVSTTATYQNLFKENWKQFCNEDDIAAIDSPVAYLNALYMFAGQLESTSTHSDIITLDQRRPDIRALMMDHQSAFVPQPMLNIINDVLSKHIETHPNNRAEKTSVYQALASEHYPFSLPYDVHHQQCLAALGPDKPALGSLNYMISPTLHCWQGKNMAGKSRLHAQTMLSDLSPEQQRILTSPLATDDDYASLKKSYGVTLLDSLKEVRIFKANVGLTTDQLDQLLARGKYHPAPSLDESSPAVIYATAYINGNTSTPHLTIIKGEDRKLLLSGASKNRLDRLQRMIRLQRWTGLHFAELDTLIVSAMRSESNVSRALNKNTLRTLGVFRYLARRYTITAQEFAAFLHDMPTQACGEQMPLFKQVFNRSGLFISPLQLAPSRLLDKADVESQQTLSQLGAGLALTQDELSTLMRQTQTYIPQLSQDLPAISSLYRQTRIAKMFGLSTMECTALAKLLGADDFCELLVRGTLSATPEANLDILDVLMAIDWAVEWFKHTRRDVTSVQKVLVPLPDDWPFDKTLQDRLRAIHSQANPDPEQKERMLENFFLEMTELPASYLPCASKLAATTTEQIWQNLKAPYSNAMPDWLARMFCAAVACRDLHLSDGTLALLLENPAWLAPDNQVKLTLQNLYLFDSFRRLAHAKGNSEKHLLHYLQLANQVENRPKISEFNQMLAALLDWGVDEVSALIEASGGVEVTTMEGVDWIMRCQTCCQSTGLSAANLIKASALTCESPATDWHAVSAALIAARH
ncbi:toxin [Pseudomonas sp. SWRI153]|uniref:Toxin n=1 Tax=Pseudomonas khorasanensis TaxID=2745508 RepID=A0A923F8T1_9PSED|nr:Tc toxin subunit A [Pseudomonas khorasanensis]MBV4488104.1 toxin [Pseudomonas khorasanensis]